MTYLQVSHVGAPRIEVHLELLEESCAKHLRDSVWQTNRQR